MYHTRIWAIHSIRIQMYEDFYFGRSESIPFTCPHPDCSVILTKMGEWTYHSTLTHHDKKFHVQGHNKRKIDSEFRSCDSVPDEVELPLLEMETEYQNERKDLEFESSKLRELCGEAGSEKRQLFEEAFVHQLESDPHNLERLPAWNSREFLSYYTPIGEGRY
jgi:hypothetical protein